MTRYAIDPDESNVWIEGSSSVHPIRAQASGLGGWIDLPGEGAPLDAELQIEVERLRSGNPLVDRETRRRIDAGNHPLITGRVTGAAQAGDDSFDLSGDLTFRGEVCSVSGQVAAVLHDRQLKVEGEQRFDVRDWGLRLPRLGLLRVHPEVNVRVQIVAVADS